MKRNALLSLSCLTVAALFLTSFRRPEPSLALAADDFIPADNKAIQYTGRIDFSDPKKPRFWSPGVYIQAKFTGTFCDVVVNDEVLYGTSHNYLEIVIDDQKPFRIKTTGAVNTIKAAEGLPDGIHTITICKDTESNIGYLEFVGFRCKGLVAPPAKPRRKIEFIGDSITCGMGSDLSDTPCGKGQWYDQHNAYLSYGAVTARRLKAQWQLSAVSGIGLMHSCCNMSITMPQVFDKVSVRDNSTPWDFQKYQPDVVTICLGQNDGKQEPMAFCDRYADFLHQLRQHYPKADFVCLSSPMADPSLREYQKENLTRVVERIHKEGDTKVSTFFFSRSFTSGCGSHPDVKEHEQIAQELTAYLKTLKKW